MTHYNRSVIAALATVSIALFAITIFAFGNAYSLGGDDTRLYYVYPLEMILNYASHLVTNNTLGSIPSYNPQEIWIPMLAVFSIGKILLPFINTQSLYFALNLVFGFLGMYLFLGIWIKEREQVSLKILSSLAYVYSPFLIKSVYVHQLLSMYLVSVIPLFLYLCITAVQQKKISRVFVATILYSVCSGTILTMPWFGAMVFVCLPLVLYVATTSIKTVLLYTGILVMSIALLNFHWLFHIAYSVLFNESLGSFVGNAVSTHIVTENVGMIQALSRLNPPYHQIASYLRSSWSERYTMMWTQSYGIVNFILVLLGGVFIGHATLPKKRIYLVALTMLILAILFVTPSFGAWNIQLFVSLNNSIPFFSMFRNMYDKFGPVTGFAYAFGLAMSLSILSGVLNRVFYTVLLICLTTFVALSGSGLYRTLHQDRVSNGLSGEFNTDFQDLVGYLRQEKDDGRYLWLPLNFPSYVVIEDKKHAGHYYYGTSPVQILTNKGDITGFLSFANAHDPALNQTMVTLFREKRYKDIVKIFQMLNIRYILVNRDTIPTWGLAHFNEIGERDFQTKDFESTVLGEKIRSFGGRYDLYRIHSDFLSSTFSITTSSDTGSESIRAVSSIRSMEGVYTITMPPVSGRLVFKEVYSPLWRLSSDDPRIVITNHTRANGFGNSWDLNLTPSSDSKPVMATVQFIPMRYVVLSRGISILTGILMVLYILLAWWNSTKKDL